MIRRKKEKIKKYKLNLTYNNKFLFNFVFNQKNVKIENWIF